MEKFLTLFLSLILSFSVFAKNSSPEENLTSGQKAAYYAIISQLEKDKSEDVQSITPIAETQQNKEVLSMFEVATKEVDFIISSIKAAYSKVKEPTSEFLSTSLAKYLGVIVVFKFFGYYIIEILSFLFVVMLGVVTIRFQNKMLLINSGSLINKKGMYKGKEYQYSNYVLNKLSVESIISNASWLILFIFALSFAL